MRTKLLVALALLFTGATLTQADLIDEYLGFDSIWEPGVTGLQSSYHDDVAAGTPLTGPTTGSLAPVFGPGRVSYPSGVGEVPSPGGQMGLNFDQGVLGVRLVGNDLIVRLATAVDAQAGFYHPGLETWYGQGDMFLDVADSFGMSHYALTNSWARDGSDPRAVGGNYYKNARDFHIAGGANGASLEGRLIQLGADNDVRLAGGKGAYKPNNAPDGLDLRIFAQDGLDLGDAGLTHGSVSDLNRVWHLQTWTIGLDGLSSDAEFDVGLHTAASCANDQIGGTFNVPEPTSILLVLAGVALALRARRIG